MWLTFFLAAVALVLLFRLAKYWILQPWSIHRHLWRQGIPGQYRPIIGDLLLRRKYYLADDALGYSREMFGKYGYYFHSSFGPRVQLFICDPLLIESVLKSNAHAYHKDELGQMILGSVLGYENLLLCEGDDHKRHRRLVAPLFQHQNINSMMSLMAEITRRRLRKWTATIKEQPDGPFTIDIHEEMSRLTLDIVTGCIFGTELMGNTKLHETIFDNLNIALKLIEKRIFNMIGLIPIVKELPLPSKLRIDRARHNMQREVQQIVNQRKQGLTRSSCKGPDLLDLLLMAKGDETTRQFTEPEVSDEAITFVLAGHETTSTLMAWALYNLSMHADIYEQCRNEVDTVLPDHIDELDISTIARLTYVEAVLKETLRYHQPVPGMLRTAVKDNIITATDGKQIHVKKGTDISISLNILHRLETYWTEPEKFDPSRFIGRYSDKLLAFSSGPRSCIGQNFAMLEAKIMLAMIVKHFRFELVPGQKLVPDIAVTIRFVARSFAPWREPTLFRPKYGMWMRIWSR